MMPQYYNAGQTPWGIYLATPVAPQTPQATPPGQPAAPMLRGQHAVPARPMTPIQTATPLDDNGTPQMHPTPGTLSFQGNYIYKLCVLWEKDKICNNIALHILSFWESHTTTTTPQPFYGPFSPGELVPEENFWTLWCKGRLAEAHTDYLAGCHSNRTNQCLPSPSPIFFTGRMPFLPPNQQHQSTEGN